jgi:rhomboid protease GluP
MALRERQVLSDASPPESAPVRPERRPIPWVSGGIIGLCALVFVAELAGYLPPNKAGALYGPAVSDGQWWRIFSCVFEHAGILHIGLNMSVVYTLGFTLERAIGAWRFTIIVVITSIGSAAAILALGYNAPAVGASGMILGLVGAILPIATRQGRQQIFTWLIQIALISIVPNLIPDSPLRVSWQGHLGGFLFGLPCGLLLRNGGRLFRPLAPVLLAGSGVLVWLAERFGAAVTNSSKSL